MKNKNLEICVWKAIAKQEEIQKNPIEVKNSLKKCIGCSGYDIGCKNYFANYNPKNNDPASKSRLNTAFFHKLAGYFKIKPDITQ